jgi:hypothetical protein
VLGNGKRPDTSGAIATRNLQQRSSEVIRICLARSYSLKAERFVTKMGAVALYKVVLAFSIYFMLSFG